MTITKTKQGQTLEIALEGRLDTTTSPELQADLSASLDGITELTINMEKLQYISSAGLRVLLTTQKTMNRQGTMKVICVNDTIMDIFEVTGFADFLTIE